MTGRLRFPSRAKLKRPAAVSNLQKQHSADAICDIAERAKHSKDDARDVALRANEILNVVADAVPDVTAISPSMKESIKRFAVLLNKIHRRLKSIALASGVSRAASTLRVEVQSTKIGVQQTQLIAQQTQLVAQQTHFSVQQTQLSVQQAHLSEQQVQTHLEVGKIVADSRLTVFLASP
ncbi:hypothetical protein FB451DRAFT_1569853 [Mycena latifolia]|nr:hypothetical protein FB451DRAFT_1569853 [Mycena latifolia]